VLCLGVIREFDTAARDFSESQLMDSLAYFITSSVVRDFPTLYAGLSVAPFFFPFLFSLL
jgi:hypothetical protein